MGLFSSKKDPIIIKETSDAKQQIQLLEELFITAPVEIKSQIEQDIKLLRYGVFGEEQILFELKNSHMPMYILHDLYLEDEGLTAQIDFLVITEKANFVLECKNMIGNIEINNNGDFIRTIIYGKTYKKEGIYSPITQNRRHIELIKQIRSRTKSNFLTKVIFEKYFYTTYQGIVVLANPKTVFNDKFARKEVKEQVIRVDRLVEHMRQVNSKSKDEPSSDKQMAELASFFLSIHKENQTDYLAKYKFSTTAECGAKKIADEKTPDILPQPTQASAMVDNADSVPVCPKCNAPMVLRTATKGERIGKRFWGCSNFPKCRSIINTDEN